MLTYNTVSVLIEAGSLRNGEQTIMNYEYKVDYIDAKVTDRDVDKGIAWSKITAQTETKLTERNEQGWEFYRSELISTDIAKTNCFGSETGEKTSARVLIFIFRRLVQ